MTENSIDFKSTFYRSLNEPEDKTDYGLGNQIIHVQKVVQAAPLKGVANNNGIGKSGPLSATFSNDHYLPIANGVQLSGIMLKRPFNQTSNSKWTKRFFVIKDGFLLHYPESERKTFDRGLFNLHPKGVLPLGGCTITSIQSKSNDPPYAIEISNDEYSCGFMVVGAATRKEQERWANSLQKASRITWKNFQLGDAMIRELETQGLQLSKEKQDYFEKLQEEVCALRDEIDKNEELEKIAEELEKEKSKLESTIQELKVDHDKIIQEYEETASTLKILEEEKNEMKEMTQTLTLTLTELSLEREETMKMLKNQEMENQNLYSTTEELTSSLEKIEDEIRFVLEEKSELENRCEKNELNSLLLREQNEIFSQQTSYLLVSLNDLMTQKELTESELQEEVKARLMTERRLKAAEESIQRLELVLQLETSDISQPLVKELLPDVKNLKDFFEHVAEEAELEANKPMIMKNAITARKAYINRIRNSRLEKAKLEKDKSMALIFEGEVSNEESGVRCAKEGTGLRRTKSMILNNQTQKKLKTLRRSLSTRANKRNSGEACQSIPELESLNE